MRQQRQQGPVLRPQAYTQDQTGTNLRRKAEVGEPHLAPLGSGIIGLGLIELEKELFSV
jgi:hypothetical protein